MTAFVYHGTPRESNYQPCWYCRTGNITTISYISREHAEKLHKRKIQREFAEDTKFIWRM